MLVRERVSSTTKEAAAKAFCGFREETTVSIYQLRLTCTSQNELTTGAKSARPQKSPTCPHALQAQDNTATGFLFELLLQFRNVHQRKTCQRIRNPFRLIELQGLIATAVSTRKTDPFLLYGFIKAIPIMGAHDSTFHLGRTVGNP